MNGLDAEPPFLARRFLLGWIALCAVSFFLPFIKTQIEMARSFGDRGVVGAYMRTAQAEPDIVRVDRSMSFGAAYPPLITWQEYGVWWVGQIFIKEDGYYRFLLESGEASYLSLSLPKLGLSENSDHRADRMKLALPLTYLKQGWYPIHVRRWSRGDVPLTLEIGRDGEAGHPVPEDAFRIPEDAAERVRASQRRRGGSERVGRLLWWLFFKGKN